MAAQAGTKHTSSDAFVRLSVGPYTAALRAGSVVAVMHDIQLSQSLNVGPRAFFCTDLHELLGGEARARAPFGIAVESGDELALIGVDSVGQFDGRKFVQRAMPRPGLVHPDLFEYVLGEDDELTFVFAPAFLVALTSQPASDI